MTPEEFHEIFPACRQPSEWTAAINAAWARYGFTTREAQAGFLGICGNETGGFTAVHTEDTRWSAAQMVKLFDLAPAAADALAHQSAEVRANVCYAGKIGNGDASSGDGWKYRGRGIIQLTGRANYRAAGQALGLDLEADPDLVIRSPAASAAAAAWFMAEYAKILPKLNAPSEASFLEGAGKVGWTDAAATARRKMYRTKALGVLTKSLPQKTQSLTQSAPNAAPALPPGRGSPAVPPAVAGPAPERERAAPGWLETLIARLLALFGKRAG